MSVANIEYRVRGLIKTLLQLNRRRKQTVVASKPLLQANRCCKQTHFRSELRGVSRLRAASQLRQLDCPVARPRTFARYEFRTNRRRQWRLRREPGLSEIASKGPGPRYGAPGMVIRDAARGRGSPRFDPGSRTGYRCSRTYDGRRSSSPGRGCRSWGTPIPACHRPRQS